MVWAESMPHTAKVNAARERASLFDKTTPPFKSKSIEIDSGSNDEWQGFHANRESGICLDEGNSSGGGESPDGEVDGFPGGEIAVEEHFKLFNFRTENIAEGA